MSKEKILKLIKNRRGGEWLWIKTRPANHWIWRFCQALGKEHLPVLPKLMRELAGFRGFPSRRILKYWNLRDELNENRKLYQNRRVPDVVDLLKHNVRMKVTPKFVYELAKDFGLKVGKKL